MKSIQESIIGKRGAVSINPCFKYISKFSGDPIDALVKLSHRESSPEYNAFFWGTSIASKSERKRTMKNLIDWIDDYFESLESEAASIGYGGEDAFEWAFERLTDDIQTYDELWDPVVKDGRHLLANLRIFLEL